MHQNQGFFAFEISSAKILLARPHQTSSMTPRWSQKHHGQIKAVFLVIGQFLKRSMIAERSLRSWTAQVCLMSCVHDFSTRSQWSDTLHLSLGDGKRDFDWWNRSQLGQLIQSMSAHWYFHIAYIAPETAVWVSRPLKLQLPWGLPGYFSPYYDDTTGKTTPGTPCTACHESDYMQAVSDDESCGET